MTPAPARVVTEAAPALTLGEIFRDNARYVGRVLSYLGVADADVEDTCQEVFLVVHRKLGDFTPGTSLRAWLYAICLRVASDHRQRAYVRRERVTDNPPEGVTGASQHQALEDAHARRVLRRALGDLDEDKRAVFVLYEIEELPMAEVAQALGCPLQTAYSRLHAARRIVTDVVRGLEAADELRLGGGPGSEREGQA